MDVGSTPRRTTWLRAITITLTITAGLGVIGSVVWQATDEPEPPSLVEPTEPVDQPLLTGDDEVEWFVDEPQIDFGYLADVHAASRLQFDECQQDFAAITDESSSGRHPLYFC